LKNFHDAIYSTLLLVIKDCNIIIKMVKFMNDNHFVFSKTEEILDRLELLDIYCVADQVQAELVILGASGILLFMEMKKQTFRPTRDVDVNVLSTTNYDQIYELLQKVKIDTVGGVMELPPMEDFKKTELFKLEGIDFEAIKIYVPPIELLACTKIFSTREKDLRDLKETDILNLCCIEKLLDMVEEYKGYMINPDTNVHQLKEVLKEKGML